MDLEVIVSTVHTVTFSKVFVTLPLLPPKMCGLNEMLIYL